MTRATPGPTRMSRSPDHCHAGAGGPPAGHYSESLSLALARDTASRSITVCLSHDHAQAASPARARRRRDRIRPWQLRLSRFLHHHEDHLHHFMVLTSRVGRGAMGAQTCTPRSAPPTETRAPRPRAPPSHGYPAPLAGYPDNYRRVTRLTDRKSVV